MYSFPSIDHAILLETLGRVIGDGDVMWLIDRILESGVGVLSEEYDMAWFPGDDLTAALRPRGLPIGNLTSQFWANCYLNPFDQFVKRELECGGYLRYVDDFLLFSDEKGQLRDWRAASIERLAGLRLMLHEHRAQVRPVTEGIPFLGFVVFPSHRRLKRRVGIAFQRRLKRRLAQYRAGEIGSDQVAASILGWIEHVRHGDTWGLRRNLLREVVIPSQSGEVLS